MNDDLIRRLAAGMSDKHINKYIDYCAGINKAAEENTNPADKSETAASRIVPVKTAPRTVRAGKTPVIRKILLYAAVVLLIAASVFIIGRMIVKRMDPSPTSDPLSSVDVLPTIPPENYTPGPEDTPAASDVIASTDDITATDSGDFETLTPEPSGTAAPETVDPATPSDTALPATTSVPATGTPRATSTPTPEVTPGTTMDVPATATPAVTTTPAVTATPAVTPTATAEPEDYFEAYINEIYIWGYLLDGSFGLSSISNDLTIIPAHLQDDIIGVTGYAYYNKSPLKYIAYSIDDSDSLTVCDGFYGSLNELGSGLALDPDMSARSAFGNGTDPVRLHGLDTVELGIYKITFYAIFENGTQYEIKSYPLINDAYNPDNEPLFSFESGESISINLGLLFGDRLPVTYGHEVVEERLKLYGPYWDESIFSLGGDCAMTFSGFYYLPMIKGIKIDYYTYSGFSGEPQGDMVEPAFISVCKSTYSDHDPDSGSPHPVNEIACCYVGDFPEGDPDYPGFTGSKSSYLEFEPLDEERYLSLYFYGLEDSTMLVRKLTFYLDMP